MGGGPEGLMKILASLQQQPPPDGEKQALQEASTKIAMAISRIQLRSPKAARLLAESVSKIQQAQETIAQEGERPIAAPPDLGMTGGMVPPAGGAMGA